MALPLGNTIRVAAKTLQIATETAVNVRRHGHHYAFTFRTFEETTMKVALGSGAS